MSQHNVTNAQATIADANATNDENNVLPAITVASAAQDGTARVLSRSMKHKTSKTWKVDEIRHRAEETIYAFITVRGDEFDKTHVLAFVEQTKASLLGEIPQEYKKDAEILHRILNVQWIGIWRNFYQAIEKLRATTGLVPQNWSNYPYSPTHSVRSGDWFRSFQDRLLTSLALDFSAALNTMLVHNPQAMVQYIQKFQQALSILQETPVLEAEDHIAHPSVTTMILNLPTEGISQTRDVAVIRQQAEKKIYTFVTSDGYESAKLEEFVKDIRASLRGEVLEKLEQDMQILNRILNVKFIEVWRSIFLAALDIRTVATAVGFKNQVRGWATLPASPEEMGEMNFRFCSFQKKLLECIWEDLYRINKTIRALVNSAKLIITAANLDKFLQALNTLMLWLKRSCDEEFAEEENEADEKGPEEDTDTSCDLDQDDISDLVKLIRAELL